MVLVVSDQVEVSEPFSENVELPVKSVSIAGRFSQTMFVAAASERQSLAGLPTGPALRACLTFPSMFVGGVRAGEAAEKCAVCCSRPA